MTTVPTKKSLLELVLFVEDEIADIDIWESVLQKEGRALYQRAVDRRQAWTQLRSVLELVQLHEKELVAAVRRGKTGKPAPPPAQPTTESTDDDIIVPVAEEREPAAEDV